MAFYPRAAVIKLKSEWDGQALEMQTTWSPLSPLNWDALGLDAIATALFINIGDELNTPLAGQGWGAQVNDWLPAAVNQQSCEIYLMQGGFTSLFFRKVFPMNVPGQRSGTGGIMPSFNAVGFSSATTEYQKKPADFRLYGLLENDVVDQEVSGSGMAILDTMKNVLNASPEIEAEWETEGGSELYVSQWVTSVVTRLKVVNPDDPTDIDYVLPSQPGDPVFATRVSNWDWNKSVTSQISRKRRRSNA